MIEVLVSVETVGIDTFKIRRTLFVDSSKVFDILEAAQASGTLVNVTSTGGQLGIVGKIIHTARGRGTFVLV